MAQRHRYRHSKFHITLRWPREARIRHAGGANFGWRGTLRTREGEVRLGTGDRQKHNWWGRLQWDVLMGEELTDTVIGHAYSSRRRGYRKPNRFRYGFPA